MTIAVGELRRIAADMISRRIDSPHRKTNTLAVYLGGLCLALSVSGNAWSGNDPGRISLSHDGTESATVPTVASISEQLNKADVSERIRLRERFSEVAYADQLPENLDFSGFEGILERGYFGTFVFYQELSAPDRRLVFDEYRGNPDVAAIRGSVMRLLQAGG